MKVYLVVASSPTTDDVLGVYTTLEKAKEAAIAFAREEGESGVTIEPWEVDKPARWSDDSNHLEDEDGATWWASGR